MVRKARASNRRAAGKPEEQVMTRPFNTKHPMRGRSNYKKRLAKRHSRGFTTAVLMPDLATLRKWQGVWRDTDVEIGPIVRAAIKPTDT